MSLFIGVVFVLSGMLGLIYQVLWMKELRLLFGSTAQAAATTLTAFFLGLAVGGWVAARLAPRIQNALRAYGWAEIGIAVSALFYFAVTGLYASIFPGLYRAVGNAPITFLIVKFILGVLLFLPAACFMGTTLPFLAQHVVRRRGELGAQGTALYALNTLGAMAGAYLAGFHLPLWFGYHRTYVLAMGASAGLGFCVLAASRGQAASPRIEEERTLESTADGAWDRLRALAFLSGAVTLGLEVLWTQMFAQVLHNSVYSFATVLIAFLAALTAGAALAHRQSRRTIDEGRRNLIVCMLLGSLLVALSPQLFNLFTRGLSYVGEGRDFGSYQLRAFALALGVLFVPTLLLGTVFPTLMRQAELQVTHVGKTIGTLLAVNTLGAIVGSLAAGFLLLETVGLWRGIECLAVAGVLGVFLVPGVRTTRLRRAGALLAILCGIPAVTGFGNPPRLKWNAATEQVMQVWEGSSGVTAVVKDANGLRIKVNNHYTLGGSGAESSERRQGMIPLLLHPHPQNVFFLGLGTGITSSAVMGDPAPKQVTICEVVPEAVAASRTYFAPYTRGLFQDPRTHVLIEDGRTVLRGTHERYDVVVADLFVPWQAGEGTLYSEELYRTIRDRLEPGGLFAQWIPLYQMSRREFDIVARTMMAVFPQVTLWRADFAGSKPSMALVGATDAKALYPDVLESRLAEVSDSAPLITLGDSAVATVSTFLLSYCGNLTQVRDLFGDGPLATDDRPLIEYLAPITQRRVESKKATWFTGPALIDFLEEIQRRVPAAQDPYLGNLTEKQQGYVEAGLLVQKGRMFRELGRQDESEAVRQELVTLLARLHNM
jgi:spermidine synthase